MKKIILLLTVCYLKLVYCDERKDLNNLFSLPDFNHSLNVATGEWIESSTDYETAGPHPLVLKRLFCTSIAHSDNITPEWKFSLPHFNHGGIPVLEWEGYSFVYNAKRELVKATNRYGQSVKIERPNPNRIDLLLNNRQKIEYHFEKIQDHSCLKQVKRPGIADRLYSYKNHKGRILLKKRDETNGRFLEWEHDKEGRLVKTLGPAGTTKDPIPLMSIAYFDNKTEMTNPNGYKKIYSYQKDSRINKIEHFLLTNLVKTEEFNWQFDLLQSHKIFDQKGELIAAKYLEYDKRGRLIKETWEGNITGKGVEKASKTFSYDENDHLIREEEEEGKIISYRFENERLVYKKEGEIETFYSFNDQGLPISEKVVEGDFEIITFIDAYNDQGLPEKFKRTFNGTIVENKSYSYSNEGWILSETIENEQGLSSLFYERDVAGRILSSTNEKGDVERFEYDLHGNVLRHDSLKETKVMQYDYMNRIISEKDRAAYTYDSCGNTLSKTDEHGNTTYFSYDGMGRIIEIKAPLVMTLEGPQTPVTLLEYDCLDRIIKKVDPRGDTTFTRYNLRGQPIEIIYPDQTVELYEYSKSGQLIKKTLRNKAEHYFEYDLNGRLTHFQEYFNGKLTQEKIQKHCLNKVVWEKTNQTELVPSYNSKGGLDFVSLQDCNDHFLIETKKEYDPSPQIAADFKIEKSERLNELGQWVEETIHTTDSGIKVVKVFDALNRLVLTEKYDPMGSLVLKKEFIYDLVGEIVQETFQGVSNRYIRKPGGKITEMIEALDTPCQRKTSFTYDENENLSTLIKPDGTEIHFSYEKDALKELKSTDGTVHYRFFYEYDRLVRIDDILTKQTASREFNALNLITKETLINGLNLEFNYDEKGRPISIKLPDDSSIFYHYDEGRLSKVQRHDKDGAEKFSHHFLNDQQEALLLGLGILETRKDEYGRTLSITSPYRTEEYEFDTDLKKVIVDGKTEHEYTYDAFHRLIQDNDNAYEFDTQNNLKDHTCNALNQICNEGYRYDLNGNLIQNPEFTFKYDALNRLIEVKGQDAIVKYTYDPFNRRMSRNDSLFFWNGQEEIGSYDVKICDLKIMAKGKIIACEIDDVPYAVQTDLKGTPVLYINSENTMRDGPYALQGKRKDSLTGFIYFGARDFDPVSRRFISCDPKGYVDGFNLYHYAHNNPNRFIDNFGHTSILDNVKEPISYGWNALKNIYNSLNSFRDWINGFSGLAAAYKYLQESVEILLGKGFIAFAGGYSQEGQTGIFGNGEISDKVRVTFIHGILNIRADLIDNLRQLSQAHGGNNIHYLFRPTQGFAWDILKCISIKFGYVSTEAQELVRIWKSLIEEMGGVNGGGKLIHYAHSLGGTDTFTALSYLTPEEQKMIDIRTLGSATLIPQEGYYSVVNYVSVRDGVSYFDPLRYLQAVYSRSNTIFIGTFLGFPFKDHPLSTDSYQAIIRALGQAFLETYG